MYIYHSFILAIAVVSCSIPSNATYAADGRPIKFVPSQPGKIDISIGDRSIAQFVYKDSKIPRPYFSDVRTLDGIQVTRNHPPLAGQDIDDHPDFHPGIWMSFGDISGNDYWRNKAHAEHVANLEKPSDDSSPSSINFKFRYLDQTNPSKIVCEENVRYTIVQFPLGWLLVWDSTFSSDQPFYFGDQEEMGLGIRVATPIRVDKNQKNNVPAGNGMMLDAQDRKNGDQIWGNTSDWCDYSGTIDDRHVGITLFCHPDNFRPSWFHARDYGLLEANPFGRKAFGKGSLSKIVVKSGASLRLQYGIYVYSTSANGNLNLHQAYDAYLSTVSKLSNDQDDQ